jgi:hypothetical protein
MSTEARSTLASAGASLAPMAVWAVALMVVAQTADYVTFLVMVSQHGLAAERNPIVVALASEGLWALTAAKVAAIVYVASTFVVTRLRRPRMARLTLGVAILVGAIGALSNVGTM